MTRLGASAATTMMLAALVSTGDAQTPLLVPGARVRVSGPCLADLPSGPAQCAVVVGRLSSWTSDTVIVQQSSGANRAVARGDARRVEVSDGIKSHKMLGSFIGAAVGLGVGLAVSCHPAGDSGIQTLDQTVDWMVCSTFRWFAAGAGLVVGAGVGRIVGALVKSETWVSLGGDVATIGVVPRASGLALMVNLRF